MNPMDIHLCHVPRRGTVSVRTGIKVALMILRANGKLRLRATRPSTEFVFSRTFEVHPPR